MTRCRRCRCWWSGRRRGSPRCAYGHSAARRCSRATASTCPPGRPRPRQRHAAPAPRHGSVCLQGQSKRDCERERATRRAVVGCVARPSSPHLLGYILVVLNTYNATIPWARPLPARGAARCGAECGDFVSVSRNRAVFFSFFCGVGAGRGSRPRLGARG